jgi:hypothetical protein
MRLYFQGRVASRNDDGMDDEDDNDVNDNR